jgi:hypothetical protein
MKYLCLSLIKCPYIFPAEIVFCNIVVFEEISFSEYKFISPSNKNIYELHSSSFEKIKFPVL